MTLGRSTPAVRLATIEDAEAIAAIHIAGWRSAYRGLVPDAILDGFAIDERTERWRRILGSRTADDPRRTWIIATDRDVHGFAATGPGRDESAPPPAGAGEVEAIYLAPATVGRGVGRILFAHAVRDLVDRGYDPIVVWVFEANARGRRFYEAAGFRADGTRHVIDFDGTPVPEVRFRLDADGRAG